MAWYASLLTLISTGAHFMSNLSHGLTKTASAIEPAPLATVHSAVFEFPATKTAFIELNATLSTTAAAATTVYIDLNEPATLPIRDAGAATHITVLDSILPLTSELLRSVAYGTFSSGPQTYNSHTARHLFHTFRIIFTEDISVLLQRTGSYLGLFDHNLSAIYQIVLVTSLVLGMWIIYGKQQQKHMQFQNDLREQQQQIAQLQMLVESQAAELKTRTNQPVALEADTNPQPSHTLASSTTLELLSHSLSAKLEALSTQLNEVQTISHVAADEIQKLKASEAVMEYNLSQQSEAYSTRLADLEGLPRMSNDEVRGLVQTSETATKNALSPQLESLSTRLSDVTAQLRELETSSSDRTTELRDDVTGVEEGVTELTGFVSDLYDSDSKLRSRINGLEASIATLDKDGLLLQQNCAESQAAPSSPQDPGRPQTPEPDKLDSAIPTPPKDESPVTSSDKGPLIDGIGASIHATSEADAPGTGQSLGATESRAGQSPVSDRTQPKHKRAHRGGKNPRKCLFYMKGNCSKGEACDRRHDKPLAEESWKESPSPSTPSTSTGGASSGSTEPPLPPTPSTSTAGVPVGFEAFRAKARVVKKE